MVSHSRQITDVWFFVGHSIGVTLLGIHTLETAYFALRPEERGHCYIVVNGRNLTLYQHMTAAYPHITVVGVHPIYVGWWLAAVCRALVSRQLVFHPLSFGPTHSIHRFLTKLLTTKARSCSVQFYDEGRRSEVWASRGVQKNLNQSIFLSLEEAVRTTGVAGQTRQPDLLFCRTQSPAGLLPRSYVVIQPFAASVARTLPPERWLDLVRYLRQTYPEYVVVISGAPSDKTAAQPFLVDEQVYFSEDVVQTASMAGQIQLLADALLYIGVDTGPTHIAAHLGLPMVVVANNSNPCWLPTYHAGATILMNTQHCTCTQNKQGNCFTYHNGVKYYRCLFEIPQESIYQAIQSRLEKPFQTNFS